MILKVTNENTVYDGFLPIIKAQITITTTDTETHSYSRERVQRADAVAVLLLNTDTNAILLTKQFRYAVYGRVEGHLPEIPAGKIDGNDTPEETAVREVMEECGIRITDEQLIHLSSFFASPGYTTEKYHLYFAKYSNADRIGKGGGLESENEFIESYEVAVSDFLKMIEQDELPDAKTILAALKAQQKGLL